MLRVLSLILVLLLPSTAHALTKEQAQQCANTLITAYTQKRFPRELLDVDRIVRAAAGSDFRTLRKNDQTLVITVGTDILRQSFEQPTGKYQFFSVVIEQVLTETKGVGKIKLTTPQGSGTYEFVAISSNPNQCVIKAVTIGGILTLHGQVRSELIMDNRVSRFFERKK